MSVKLSAKWKTMTSGAHIPPAGEGGSKALGLRVAQFK